VYNYKTLSDHFISCLTWLCVVE